MSKKYKKRSELILSAMMTRNLHDPNNIQGKTTYLAVLLNKHLSPGFMPRVKMRGSVFQTNMR